LNKTAGQLAGEFGVQGGRDVSGYSLLGDGLVMAYEYVVSLQFNFSSIPFLSGARKYAEQGIFPGGAFDNKKHFEPGVKFADSIDEPNQMLLFDPQTSGGLLLGVPRDKVDGFLAHAREANQAIWVVGNVVEGTGIRVSS
jgi:selenide,water dikinase